MDTKIELFNATLNPSPTTGTDTSRRTYRGWSLNDDLEFNFPVDTNYVTGSNLAIVIKEGTPGVSLNHKWQAVVTLNSGTADTYTAEYVSSASANVLTDRILTISTSGQIHSVAITGGALVSVILTRITASSNEDGNDIKTYLVAHRTTVSPAATSFAGRLGTIEAKMRALFNEQTNSNAPWITAGNTLLWVNTCKNDLALENYFTRESLLDWPVSGQIDLRTELPDMVQVFQDKGTCLRMDDASYTNGLEVYWVFDQMEWTEYRTDPSRWDDPYPYNNIAWLDRDSLNLLPDQAVEISNGIKLKNSYEPIDLTGEGDTGDPGVTPPTPAPFDMLYVYYGLWCAFQKESRDGTVRTNKAGEYLGLYQAEKARLLKKKAPRVVAIEPYI